ncbi:GrdX family protein [Caldisalinibacter kiritimatiensis]|uniref:GrdX protein n=1 Tax=Caldisalinibacter kiritimatiensis TaxID=1304284 RepID=R1CLP6_9FIRM|nr:GrdX family protein [Caldisalinibacter kiritimatiensis]EOC99625.1 GrdX protein [Caldisalinibacter kiritimatiensis]
MRRILVTNNPLIKEKYEGKIDIEYYPESYIDILKKVRDKVHKGCKILTHPLSGSVKPNETPYKTVMISEDTSDLDMESLMIIESSIETALKFLKNQKTPEWNERINRDFQVIDLSLIEPTLKDNIK